MNSGSAATELSRIILIGLVLIVGLMAGLAIIFDYLGLATKDQPLGLPEGSIRSIIAFSMVLIFVSLAAFLYGGVSSGETSHAAKLTGITPTDLNTYKENFIVVHQPAKKADGAPDIDSNGNILSYDATLFVRRNKESDDFAKQIFTTLGTLFVSVISFYFGSSVTTSGIKTGETITQQRSGSINLSSSQQTQLAQLFNKAPGNPVDADIPKVGDLLAVSASSLQPCPADVIIINTGLGGCRYVLIKDEFVVAESNSLKAIAVIKRQPQSAGSSAAGNALSAAQERQVAESLGRVAGNSVEAEVPKVGDLLPDAGPLKSCTTDVSAIPSLANCRFILIKDQLVLVELNSQKVIAVIKK